MFTFNINLSSSWFIHFSVGDFLYAIKMADISLSSAELVSSSLNNRFKVNRVDTTGGEVDDSEVNTHISLRAFKKMRN